MAAPYLPSLVDDPSVPGIRWLRGNYFIDGQNGAVSHSLVRIAQEDKINSLLPSHRVGILLGDGAVDQDPQQLQTLLAEALGNEALIRAATLQGHAALNLQKEEGYLMLGGPLEVRSRQERRLELDKLGDIDRITSRLQKRIDIGAALAAVHRASRSEKLDRAAALIAAHQLSAAEFEQARGMYDTLLDNYPDKKLILEEARWPVHIVRDARALNAKNFTSHQILTINRPLLGTVIDERVFRGLQTGVPEVRANFLYHLNASQVLSAYLNVGCDLTHYGVDGPAQWQRVSTQTLQLAQTAMPGIGESAAPPTPWHALHAIDMVTNDASDDPRRRELELSPQQIREIAPDAMAFHDAFQQAVRDKAQAIRAARAQAASPDATPVIVQAVASPEPAAVQSAPRRSGLLFLRGGEATVSFPGHYGKPPPRDLSRMVVSPVLLSGNGLQPSERQRKERLDAAMPYDLTPIVFDAAKLLEPGGLTQLKQDVVYAKVKADMDARHAAARDRLRIARTLYEVFPAFHTEPPRPFNEKSLEVLKLNGLHVKAHVQAAQLALARPEILKSIKLDPLSEAIYAKPEFEAVCQQIEESPVMTPVVTALLAQSRLPMFVLNVDRFTTPDAKETFSHLANTGLLFFKPLTDDLASPDEHVRQAATRRLALAVLTSTISHSIGKGFCDPVLQQAPAAADAMKSEFNARATSKANDTDRPFSMHDYFVIMTNMHTMLHDDRLDPDVVRQSFPLCVAAYDRCMAKMTELAQRTDPSLSLPDVPMQAAPVQPVPPAPVPYVALEDWTFRPERRFSESGLEAELLNDARPFVEDALRQAPPFTQCHVRLMHNQAASDVAKSGEAGARQRNYRLTIFLRNEHREERSHSISTGTSDLGEAIALKRALQSHLLSHPSLQPTYLPLASRHAPGYREIETFVPHWAIQDSALVDHHQFFGARLTFARPAAGPGSDGPEVTATLPLGLPYQPQDGRLVEEAQRRLQFLHGRIHDLIQTGAQASLGELIADLKLYVMESRATAAPGVRDFKWEAHSRLRLPEYALHDNALAFPDPVVSSTQRTLFDRPYIQRDDKPANPTWRVHLPLKITGFDAEGGTFARTISVNLHTDDREAAQLRAYEVVDSLVATMETMRQRHPQSYWQPDIYENPDTKTLYDTARVTDIEGHQPRDPDPVYLEHVHDDLAHCRMNFRIVQAGEPQRQPDGKLRVTLGIERGTADLCDLTRFKDSNGREVEASFLIDPQHQDRLDEFVAAIRRTFDDDLAARYSNRTVNARQEIVRQRRDQFHPATIRNCFHDAITSHIHRSGFGNLDGNGSGHADRFRQDGQRRTRATETPSSGR